MKLSPALNKRYTRDAYSTLEAQKMAEIIAFGPGVFQVSRLMLKWGIFQLLRESKNGLTAEEVADKTLLSVYAVKVLLNASLTVGTVLTDEEGNRYTLSKIGWFVLSDSLVRTNMDFVHEVNYLGWFNLEESLKNGKPAGLEHWGAWSNIYEGFSSLPASMQRGWSEYNHFYSEKPVEEALKIVFAHRPKNLLDVGGNIGRWALHCVDYDKEVHVTVLDLPQQVERLEAALAGQPGGERISGYAADLLDPRLDFPVDRHYDCIWMSQLIDSFSEKETADILRRAAKIMDETSRLYIMDFFWNRQPYDTGAFCLTHLSLYFSAMATGKSRVYALEDITPMLASAGLEIDAVHDNLGYGHTVLACRLKR